MEAQPKEASSTRSVGRKSHADAYARPAKQTAGSYSDFREAPFVRVSTIPMHQLKPLSPFFVSGLAPNECGPFSDRRGKPLGVPSVSYTREHNAAVSGGTLLDRLLALPLTSP